MWKFFWLLWLVLSAFVLIVYGWSIRVLFQQKAAWKKFSEKNKLEYEPGRLVESPRITGRYKNHRFYLYTGVQTTPDVRGQRFVTILEVELGKGVPVAGVLGTANMETFIVNLNFSQEYTPNNKHWDDSYSMKTRNASVLRRYLTDERFEVINKLFSMKNSDVLLFFDDVDSVLRVETSDPLRDADRLEKILTRILGYLEVLRVTDKEFQSLEKLMEEKKTE